MILKKSSHPVIPCYFGHFPCPWVKPLHFLQILVIQLYNRVGTVLECNLKMDLLYSTLKSYDVSFYHRIYSEFLALILELKFFVLTF